MRVSQIWQPGIVCQRDIIGNLIVIPDELCQPGIVWYHDNVWQSGIVWQPGSIDNLFVSPNEHCHFNMSTWQHWQPVWQLGIIGDFLVTPVKRISSFFRV